MRCIKRLAGVLAGHAPLERATELWRVAPLAPGVGYSRRDTSNELLSLATGRENVLHRRSVPCTR